MVESIRHKESPSQTAGPYVHIGCLPNFLETGNVYSQDLGATMYSAGGEGEPITLTCRLFDGAGAVIKDAMVEIWQADAQGRAPAPGEPFTGWGRQACDRATGVFTFQTIKPGAIVSGALRQSPHISVWIVARGINLGLHTRLYFPDEDNRDDPVLALLDHARRTTLIAVQKPAGYVFDIYLQGDAETVFFDV